MAFAEQNGYDRVFGLIDRLVQSTDARLRGNALQALAALTDANDPSASATAQLRLTELLAVEDIPLMDTRWREMLSASIFDVLKQLPEQRRYAIAEDTLARLRKRDLKRHSTVFTALMEAHASGLVGRGFRSRLGSWQWQAYGISIVGLMLRCAWRFLLLAFLAWIIIFILLNGNEQQGGGLFAGIIMLLTPVFAVFFGLTSRLSIIGRPPLSRMRYLIDVLVGAITMAMFSSAGACIMVLGWTPTLKVGAWSVVIAAVGGFAAGAAVRALRWPPFPGARELQAQDKFVRVLAAIAIATLICAIAAFLGFPAAAAWVWMSLAPACAAISWLDAWLEARPPEYVAAKAQMPRPLLFVPIAAAVLLVSYNFWMPAVLKISRPLSAADASQTVDLGSLKTGDAKQVSLAYGNTLKVSGGGNASFVINAHGMGDDNIVLESGETAPDEEQNSNRNSADETTVRKIREEYWFCIDAYSPTHCHPGMDTPDGLPEMANLGRKIFIGKGFGMGPWRHNPEKTAAPGPNSAPDVMLTITKSS